MFSPSIVWLLGASIALILYPTRAFSAPYQHPNSAIQTVYQFPNLTWVENIAVRSNGQLLVTTITSPDLYLINPFAAQKQAKLIARFPFAQGALGIAEIEQDVFAVITGNFSVATLQSVVGSYSVWKVDLRKSSVAPVLTKIANVAQGALLNGMTALRNNECVTAILVSDTFLGVVWRVDVLTGEYQIVLDDALMKPPPGSGVGLGINGVHILDGVLYFTNTGQGLFGKVPIHPNGTAAGEAVIVAQNGPGDDFALDKHGNAFVAQNVADALQLITPAGEVKVIAGSVNDTVLEGDTAAQFGRTPLDRNILYVTTNGGIVGLVPGTQIEGGKVVAVDISALTGEAF
jgi:hypothetical protein